MEVDSTTGADDWAAAYAAACSVEFANLHEALAAKVRERSASGPQNPSIGITINLLNLLLSPSTARQVATERLRRSGVADASWTSAVTLMLLARLVRMT